MEEQKEEDAENTFRSDARCDGVQPRLRDGEDAGRQDNEAARGHPDGGPAVTGDKG